MAGHGSRADDSPEEGEVDDPKGVRTPPLRPSGPVPPAPLNRQAPPFQNPSDLFVRGQGNASLPPSTFNPPGSLPRRPAPGPANSVPGGGPSNAPPNKIGKPLGRASVKFEMKIKSSAGAHARGSSSNGNRSTSGPPPPPPAARAPPGPVATLSIAGAGKASSNSTTGPVHRDLPPPQPPPQAPEYRPTSPFRPPPSSSSVSRLLNSPTPTPAPTLPPFLPPKPVVNPHPPPPPSAAVVAPPPPPPLVARLAEAEGRNGNERRRDEGQWAGPSQQHRGNGGHGGGREQARDKAMQLERERREREEERDGIERERERAERERKRAETAETQRKDQEKMEMREEKFKSDPKAWDNGPWGEKGGKAREEREPSRELPKESHRERKRDSSRDRDRDRESHRDRETHRDREKPRDERKEGDGDRHRSRPSRRTEGERSRHHESKRPRKSTSHERQPTTHADEGDDARRKDRKEEAKSDHHPSVSSSSSSRRRSYTSTDPAVPPLHNRNPISILLPPKLSKSGVESGNKRPRSPSTPPRAPKDKDQPSNKGTKERASSRSPSPKRQKTQTPEGPKCDGDKPKPRREPSRTPMTEDDTTPEPEPPKVPAYRPRPVEDSDRASSSGRGGDHYRRRREESPPSRGPSNRGRDRAYSRSRSRSRTPPRRRPRSPSPLHYGDNNGRDDRDQWNGGDGRNRGDSRHGGSSYVPPRDGYGRNYNNDNRFGRPPSSSWDNNYRPSAPPPPGALPPSRAPLSIPVIKPQVDDRPFPPPEHRPLVLDEAPIKPADVPPAPAALPETSPLKASENLKQLPLDDPMSYAFPAPPLPPIPPPVPLPAPPSESGQRFPPPPVVPIPDFLSAEPRQEWDHHRPAPINAPLHPMVSAPPSRVASSSSTPYGGHGQSGPSASPRRPQPLGPLSRRTKSTTAYLGPIGGEYLAPEVRFTPYSVAGRPKARQFVGSSHVRDYQLGEKIGEGTFGVVWKATRKAPDAGKVKRGAVVALKEIILHNESDGMPITSLREIRILKALDHPNIVPVVDMAYEDGDRKGFKLGKTFMVFPYLDHDLAGLLENNMVRLEEADVKQYAKQLLHGTAYLHQNGILHRDMKAANLLINNEGTLMIADFGLARSIYKASLGREYTNCVVTRWYRPPELLLGEKKYHTAVDMWGVGCVIAEMFQKTPIFPGASDFDQAEQIFAMCGNPTEETMPGFSKLPGCDGKNNWRYAARNVIQQMKQLCNRDCFADLLDKIFVLDPKRRLTAAQALNHDWFWTNPLPTDPKKLRQHQTSHEIDRRRRDEEQQAMRQHPQRPPLQPHQPMAPHQPQVAYH